MSHRPDYFWHLLGWAGPVLGAQWLVGRRLLRPALRPIAFAVALSTAYLSAVDAVAIESGIWGFGEGHLLGWRVGSVPIEESLFFACTALLVSQAMVLFLRWPARRA